ncbi:MAG: diguanylate cyclase [Firmicutes bacterium HGW-Firmicutes-12]|nr:MAG: diguanylate cyclase [Firmicutes bacterium HGW-Firmicutes-12]
MEQKFIQELLKKAPFGYAFHRLVYNNLGEVEDYIFLDLNPAFEELTGLSKDKILGKRVIEVLPDIREGEFDWVYFYGQVTLSGKSQNFTQYSESLKRWYKVTVWSFAEDHFVTIFNDISSEMDNIDNLKKQKREIESLSGELETIFNSTHDAMFLVKYEDGEFRYIRNNKAHQELTGVSLDYIQGKTPIELAGKEVGEIFQLNYKICIDSRKTIMYEENLQVFGKKRIWETILNPVFEEEEIKFIVGSSKDITLQRRAQKDRDDLLQRLQSMFNEHNAVMLIIEPLSGRIADANPAACQFYGYSHEEITNLCIQDINILTKEEVKERCLLVLKEKQRYFIHPHRVKKGEIRLVDVYACPITFDGKKHIYSIIFDATDREKYKGDLYLEKEMLKTTLLSIGDGVVTSDLQGRITSMNKVAEMITAWHENDAKGQLFSEVFKLVNEETKKEVQNPIDKVLRTGRIIGLANHTALINKDGLEISIADSAAPIKNENGQIFGVVMIFRDVSQEKVQQDKILFLSYHDPLTGLYNRRFMEEQIKRIDLSRELPFTVIMGDVNGLKLVNDVFGHEEGDKLLKESAEIITASCRKGDIIARWGGDEFLIFLTRTSLKTAHGIIQRIKKGCERSNEVNIKLSISLGCAVKYNSQESIQDVIKEAEELMYRQKLMEGQSYRNTIINTMLATMEAKSMETEEHAERLKKICLTIGQEMDLSDKQLDELALLAVLHDIGKIGVKESILQKNGPLNDEEWAEMRKHPEIGYRIAQNTPELAPVAEYILSHHERWDGKGYPRGYTGTAIPKLSRILAVADAYDAMTNDRIYRKSMSQVEAIEELKRNTGTQFDPVVVEVFLKLYS